MFFRYVCDGIFYFHSMKFLSVQKYWMKSLQTFVVNKSLDRNDKSDKVRNFHNMQVICFARVPYLTIFIQPIYATFVTLCNADAVFLM